MNTVTLEQHLDSVKEQLECDCHKCEYCCPDYYDCQRERERLIKKIVSNPAAYAPGPSPQSMTMKQLYKKANEYNDDDTIGQYSVPTLTGNDQMVVGFVNAKKVYTEYVSKIFDEYLDSLRECESIHDMNRIRTKLAWIARENDEHDKDDYIHQLELNF
jgi:hypothetical protein